VKTLPIILLAAWPLPICAQLEKVPDHSPQIVFSGQARKIQVLFHNPTDRPLDAKLRTRVFQASSATAMPLGEPRPWKTIRVLPGQTIVESASLDFPDVKVGTHFVVHWLDDRGKALEPTDVIVHPTGLFKAFKTLAGERSFGVLDPQDRLKPLLKESLIEFSDLETADANFNGRLMIVGPFATREDMPAGLIGRIKAIAKKGCAVIWIQPPPEPDQKHSLSVCLLREGAGVVVLARAELFSDLAESPQAQLDLIYLAGLALKPDQWESNLLIP